MDHHQFREEENGFFQSLFTNCSEMSTFGTHSADLLIFYALWPNLLVRSRTVQKLATNVWLVWSVTFITHVNTSKIAMWETQHNIAEKDCFKTLILQETWRLESNIRMNSVHFRKSHVRANKLDVQETDFCFTQFYRSWGDFSRCRFTHGWSHPLDLLDLVTGSLPLFIIPKQQNKRCKRVMEKLVSNSSTKHAKTDPNHEHQSRSDQYWSRSIKRNTFWFQCYVVCLWGQWSRQKDYNKRPKSPQWDMCEEPTELLRIGCLTRLILILKFRFNTLTPKHQLADILTKSGSPRCRRSRSVSRFCLCSFIGNTTAAVVRKGCSSRWPASTTVCSRTVRSSLSAPIRPLGGVLFCGPRHVVPEQHGTRHRHPQDFVRRMSCRRRHGPGPRCLWTDIKSPIPIRAQYRHFRTICEQTVDNSPTDPFSSSLSWWSSMHGVATLYVELCHSPIRNILPRIFLHDIPCHRTPEDIISASSFLVASFWYFSVAPTEILDSNIHLSLSTKSVLIWHFRVQPK